MQKAFRGVLACQRPGNGNLPGKARGFRGQDTVERHDGLSVVMEKIDQWEQENPASKGREMIDDFRLPGSRTWRRMGGHLTKEGWLTQVAHQVAHAFDHHNASLSEGAPRCCGRGLAWKALLEAGWRGFPASAATTVAGRSPACPRLATCVNPKFPPFYTWKIVLSHLFSYRKGLRCEILCSHVCECYLS